MGTVLSILVGLLPVMIFLITLWRMDRHQLTPIRRVVLLIIAGMGMAWVSLAVSGFLVTAIPADLFKAYGVPLVEELAKALVIVALFRASRIGFLVDAAILGFAVGAGFALAENLYLLAYGAPMGEGVWLVRGFGTAVMHGGVTAIFAVLAQRFTDRSLNIKLVAFLPGLAVATSLHWAFNQFYFSPLLHTVLVLTLLPLVLVMVFRKSADDLYRWMHMDFDADAALIRDISTGQMSNNRAGRFLADIRDRFPGPVVGDMLCYLRIYTELALRAKGVLMMREHGIEPDHDPEVNALFEELRFLRKSIGRVGILALQPFLHYDRKDLWQLTVLQGRYRKPRSTRARRNA